jgi:asparagine synthase (glutamine-hydrolysing)
MTKHIFREAMVGVLPEKIRLRNDKIGFSTPESVWFRQKNFQTYIENLIRSNSFRSRNIFNPDKIENLYNKHLVGKIDASRVIWKSINLENWYREFID